MSKYFLVLLTKIAHKSRHILCGKCLSDYAKDGYTTTVEKSIGELEAASVSFLRCQHAPKFKRTSS